jgi:sec-independent protein translocase protein TatA
MVIGPFQLLLIVIVALLVFGGRGKISSIMGDLANGIRSFRKGLNDKDEGSNPALPAANETVDVTATRTSEKDRAKG